MCQASAITGREHRTQQYHQEHHHVNPTGGSRHPATDLLRPERDWTRRPIYRSLDPILIKPLRKSRSFHSLLNHREPTSPSTRNALSNFSPSGPRSSSPLPLQPTSSSGKARVSAFEQAVLQIGMTESRTELLAWVNNLLQTNYTRIEHLGTGAAHCQIFDSIYGDVQLSRVKFNTKQEYEYINNFKVLQHTFLRHKIEKPIPVERLVKCRFQDNIEFLQWVKRYWDITYPGGNYDAVGRRGGAVVAPVPAAGSARASASSVARKGLSSRPGGVTATRAPIRSNGPGGMTGRPAGMSGAVRTGAGSADMNRQVSELNKQIEHLNVTVEGLEHERDFYFGKLRVIEILLQQLDPSFQSNAVFSELIQKMQDVLYSTEEGFEAPEQGTHGGGEGGKTAAAAHSGPGGTAVAGDGYAGGGSGGGGADEEFETF